ncbi:hypothetical protein ACX0G7_24735 [Flavitalea antarctica]
MLTTQIEEQNYSGNNINVRLTPEHRHETQIIILHQFDFGNIFQNNLFNSQSLLLRRNQAQMVDKVQHGLSMKIDPFLRWNIIKSGCYSFQQVAG